MPRKTKNVLTIMIIITVFLGVGTVFLFLLHNAYQKAWMLATAVTFLTFFYHLAMRLLVGEMITVIFQNKSFEKEKHGFRIYSFEGELYKKLKVKEWKKYMMTAKPEQFDLKSVDPEELLHNVMQAELVHRIIMPLSFVPLIFIVPFGEPLVFIITSFLACLLDGMFVIIQRYNRPRVESYIDLAKNK